jgi:transcriptional regulator with XRE-family HTH domain
MLKWHVKEMASAKGMSLKVLAQRSGMSYSTIRRICQRPFLRYGKVTTLVKLARALEVPLSALVEDVPCDDQHAGDMEGHLLRVPGKLIGEEHE